jgi:hypothetical protein
MESPIQNMQEKSFISESVLLAAERILDRGDATVFQELELGYDTENPMYISEDATRLPVIVHQLEKEGKTYFLGYARE